MLSGKTITRVSLPHLNANVERIFIQMNIPNTKLRKLMDVSILKAILIGTCGLRHSQKCYNDSEYLTIQKHTEIMDCINCQHIVIPSKMIIKQTDSASCAFV